MSNWGDDPFTIEEDVPERDDWTWFDVLLIVAAAVVVVVIGILSANGHGGN